MGAAAGYFDFEDDQQAWADVKLRYYPSARAPRGFAVGLLVGVVRYDRPDDGDPLATTEPRTGPTAGVVLDYSWLLGRSRRFYVGTGLGAKRVFAISDDDPDDNYPEVLGAVRIQIGYAF